MLLAAPGAGAASPQDICNALNAGASPTSFTLADLQAYQNDPTVQGYCPPVSIPSQNAAEVCRNAQGQPLDTNGNVVADVSQAAPASSGCAHAAPQQSYCKNAQGQPVNAKGEVVRPEEAAPMSSGCSETTPSQSYCRNSQGQLLNAQGEVVQTPAEAAPAGSACAHARPQASVIVPAPAPQTSVIAPAPTKGVKGAQKTLTPAAPKAVAAPKAIVRPAPVIVKPRSVAKPTPVAKPAPVAKQAPVAKPAPVVAPANKAISRPAPVVAPANQSGTLPFTGLQLGLFSAIGLALLVSGLLLWTTSRKRGSS